MSNDQIEFSVVGIGRFGAFWGKHLSNFYSTCFYDIDQGKRNLVKNYGVWKNLETCLAKDYIFLTIPIRKIPEFLETNSSISSFSSCPFGMYLKLPGSEASS